MFTFLSTQKIQNFINVTNGLNIQQFSGDSSHLFYMNSPIRSIWHSQCDFDEEVEVFALM